MECKEITQKILNAAYQVHTALGPGLLESAYKTCLAYELKQRGYQVEVEVALPLVYGDIKMDCGYRMDLVVEGDVVVEIKSVTDLTAIHTAQMITYLKLSHMDVGLLLNFNVRRLSDGIKRVVYTHTNQSNN